MKVQRKLVLYFLPLITLVSFTTDVVASCPTMQQGPPCMEYWQTDAVFIGVANRVVHNPDKPSPENWMYVRTTVYFTIEEPFKGVGGNGLVFNLDHCGHPFKEGERYLVYARRNHNNNELEVRAGWTRTRPLSEATEDLNYIRGLSSAEPGSRVFGTVAQNTLDVKESHHKAESLPNIKVTLEGNNQRLEVVTDSEGRYEFKGIEAGTYRLRAEMPAYLKYDEFPIKLKGRGCAPINISASRKGEIVGRVLDVNGKPLNDVPVSLVSADASLEEILAERKDRVVWTSGYTNREGRYEFSHLPPGRYLLIINRADFEKSLGSLVSRALPRLFYPGVTDLGGATVIVVGTERDSREHDFRLTIQQ